MDHCAKSCVKMAQENTVSFKVFLQLAGEKPEVRRFGIDRDVVSNFSYLKEKLQTVFPTLKSKEIIVSWKDDEGDEIVISSDDELMIALTEMQADVRKLYVTVSDVPQQKSTSSPGSTRNVCIICDECDKTVEGFCYKCIQCPDYDLCASCEGKGKHAEHFMIRSPVPISWRPQFGRRLAHQLSKSSRRACHNASRECPVRDQKHPGGHFPFLDLVGTYLSAFVNPSPGDKETRGQGQNEASTSQNESASATTNDAKRDDSHIAYLMNVGKTVAEMLDPLGIDVEVSVSDNKNKKTAKASDGKKSPKKEKSPVRGIFENEKEVPKPEVVKKDTPPVQEDVKEQENKTGVSGSPLSQSERESPENDGWTVLNKETQQNQLSDNVYQSENKADAVGGINPALSTKADVDPAQAAHRAASAAANAAAAAMARAATGAIPKHNCPIYYPPPPHFGVQQGPTWPQYPVPPTNMYPVLPPTSEPQGPSQAAALQQPLHANPKIAEAVQTMMAMGFSNEGGWLTQLLEIKNGDIVKALDVLQPVKK
ncbi:sequestosome-1 isoform X2 [Anabrus simplex]|uniref:sequestosome-1 isoform X2 n=1 Tax=Anabrus simplex TaxID=316456 RepID=UPI0035A39DD0